LEKPRSFHLCGKQNVSFAINQSEELLSVNRDLECFDAIAYDTVWAYAHASKALLDSGDTLDGVNLFKHLEEVNFEGVTGNFSFNDQGDRRAVYDIVNFSGDQDGSGEPQIVGNWTFKADGIPGELFVDKSRIYWPTRNKSIPILYVPPPVKYWSCHGHRSRVDPTG
jgi:hypothetical protein